MQGISMSRALLASPALLLAGLVLSAEPAPQRPPQAQLLDRVVAIVDDGIVTQSGLDEAIGQAVARLRQNNTQLPPMDTLRRQVLDRLVMEEIQAQRAERIGIEVTDEMVNDELKRLAQDNGL